MKELLIQLLDYEHWANQRVISTLQQVSAPPSRAVEVMGHILSAQEVWFNRITGNPSPTAVWQEVPVQGMNSKAERQYQVLKAYLNEISEQTLATGIAYRNSKGDAFENTLRDILTHLSHHAAYHRGQVIQLLRPYVAQLPATDYIVWIRNP